jgi:hypothetical protein
MWSINSETIKIIIQIIRIIVCGPKKKGMM